MDAGGIEQTLHTGVAQQVLATQVLSQVEQQLAAGHFIAMNVANELDLGLHCRRGRDAARLTARAGLAAHSEHSKGQSSSSLTPSCGLQHGRPKALVSGTEGSAAHTIFDP